MSVAEAFVVGVSHGWSHANYAENVAGYEATEDEAETVEVPLAYGRRREESYRTGYAEGIERYNNDQYTDGTPVVDEEN